MQFLLTAAMRVPGQFPAETKKLGLFIDFAGALEMIGTPEALEAATKYRAQTTGR